MARLSVKAASRALVAVVVILVTARFASAHAIPFSYLDLHIERASLQASIVVHVYDAAHDLSITPIESLLDHAIAVANRPALARLVVERLQISVDGRPLPIAIDDWSAPEVLTDRQSLKLTARIALERAPGIVTVHAMMFPYDPNHQTFVNIYDGEALTQVSLDVRKPQFDYFAGTRQGVVAVLERFIPAGIRHILIGPDHVLFLLGLLLVGGTLGRLALVGSGFTVAHSITLSLAALGLVSPPSRLIEPAIALSIIYVGVDNLVVRGGRDVRAWIAFGFGFIHGFGFAGVLREMDLPARALGWSLFSFNLGVEIGQLAIIVAVASAVAALRTHSEKAWRRLVIAGSIVIVCAGAFWFIQRVFFVV